MHCTDSNNKTFCELLCSTSKVAPLKQLTIPRLELCAATLLSKLYKKVVGALNLTINDFYLWTDSSILLTWIQGPPNKWKIFEGSSVALIQEEVASVSWTQCLLNPILLISFQEELNLQLCQHQHYGGRDNNGFHRIHPAGLQQRLTQPKTT